MKMMSDDDYMIWKSRTSFVEKLSDEIRQETMNEIIQIIKQHYSYNEQCIKNIKDELNKK